MLKEVFEELFPSHAFEWKASGVRDMGICPFHSDRHPSLSIIKNTNGEERWYCFAEGIGGDAVDAVIRAVDDISTVKGATTWLVEHDFVVEDPETELKRLRNTALNKFRLWTNELLRTSEKAQGVRNYIAARRHINPKLLEDAEVGYYPTLKEVLAWLVEEGYYDLLHDEIAPDDSNSKSAHLKMLLNNVEGSLLFFYRTSYHEYTRVKYRNVLKERSDSKDKVTGYLGKKEQGKNEDIGFFSWFHDIDQIGIAVIVEGEFDVGCLIDTVCAEDEYGNAPIFCFGGGASMSKGVKSLTHLGIDTIHVFPDNDARGLTFAADLAKAHPNVKVTIPVDYGKGEDPADWAIRSTKEDFIKIIKDATDAYIYVTKLYAENYLAIPDAKKEEKQVGLREFLIFSKKLDIEEKEIAFNMFSTITEVSLDTLEDMQHKTSSTMYKAVRTKGSYGVYMRSQDQKKADWEEVSNVIVECLYDTVRDMGGGEVTRISTLRASLSPERTVTFDIDSDEFYDDKKFQKAIRDRLGSRVNIKPRKAPFLRDSINELSKIKDDHYLQTYTGWNDDLTEYCAPGGWVDKDGFHEFTNKRVELPQYPNWYGRYKLYAECTDEEFEDAKDFLRNKFLKIYPYETTLPILAHMFWTVLAPFLPECYPYALWIWGKTGSKKTGYTKKMMHFFGDFYSLGSNKATDQAFATWRSTSNSLEVCGYPIQDLPYAIDDYKIANCKKEDVVSFIQNYADRAGKGRCRATLESQKSRFVRGNVICTGEDIVEGEASTIARMIIVHTPTSKCDLDLLVETDTMMDKLHGVMTRFIHELCVNPPDREALKELYTARTKIYKTTHDRLSCNLAANSVAWDITAKFLGLEDLTPIYKEGMKDIMNEMEHKVTSERASSIVIDTLREMLDSTLYYLQGLAGCESTEHNERSTLIGYVDKEFVYLSTNFLTCLKEYYRRGHQTTLEYSKQAVHDQLLTEGYLVPGKRTLQMVKTINGTSKTLTRIRKEAIEVQDEEPTTENELAPGIPRGTDEVKYEKSPY